MNVYLGKRIIEDTKLSDDAIITYLALRMICRKDKSNYYISLNMLDYYLHGKISSNRYTIAALKRGIHELINFDFISLIDCVGKNEYVLDLSKIYFDIQHAGQNKNYFVIVSTDEIYTIMNYDTKDNFKLCRYFVYLIGTFYLSKDKSANNNGMIGFMSISIMSDNTNICTRSIKSYNAILQDLKLIYVYKSDEILKTSDGEITGFSNTYGRYKDKEIVIKAGKAHEKEYGSKHQAEVKRAIKVNGDKMRSYTMKFLNFKKGKEYPYSELKEIYLALHENNKSLIAKYKNHDNLKDLTSFSDFDFYISDDADTPNCTNSFGISDEEYQELY